MMYEVVYGTSNEVGGDDGGGRWRLGVQELFRLEIRANFRDTHFRACAGPGVRATRASVAPVESRLRSLWIWIWGLGELERVTLRGRRTLDARPADLRGVSWQ